MLRRRVIPCLDVADGRVVKGTRFVDLVDEGDPPELAERYAAEGADELVFLDITAAPERRVDAPRHRRADGPPRVHPADRRRRRADRRRDARRPAGRRGQGLAQHGRRRRPDAHQPLRGTVRAPGGRRRHRRAGRRAGRLGRDGSSDAVPGGRRRNRRLPVLGGRRQGRPRSRPGSTSSPGPSAPSSSAPASCWSPRSTATGPDRASTPTCCGRSRRGRRAGHRVGRRGRPGRFRRARSATAAPTPSSPPRSSTAGSTPSPTSRPRWPRPACRSGSAPQAVA